MRDIKFRAWDTYNKEMLEVQELDYVDSYNGQPMVRTSMYRDYFDTEDMILMQYTGLKDKNGKEIYEGDICLYIGSDGKGDISYPYCGEQRSFVGEKIVIDSYQSMIIGRHISTYKESINFSAPNGIINGWEIIKPYDLWNHQGWIEVIGNIYENKNLLKEDIKK